MKTTPEFFDFSHRSRTEITKLLQEYNLRLTVDEALLIQNKFLHRPPTYAECVLWSIQGSEHCSYKSSRKHLQQFNTKAPHVILGPSEDAGIVSVATDKEGRRYGIVMSHESHNHPSQLVPYEGAATGVGGNVRDVCCMGAEVIAVADSLRFGDINRAKTKWIQQGVVSGIAGYSNPLGIPNLAGDVYYHKGYNENCLVTVVTLGVVREDHIIHSYAPRDANADDYHFILVGKPTDNSGFGGAAFASADLDAEQEDDNKGAVQDPNAFLQRHILKANYAMFSWLQEQNLQQQVGFKDLGAGGIACASIELAEGGGFGAEINLETVPVSMLNLLPAVILCSETQERFMWVVPGKLVDTFLAHYNQRFALPDICDGAQATVIGRLRKDDQYIVHYHDERVVQAKASDITQGILYDRPWQNKTPPLHETPHTPPDNLNDLFAQLLTHPNIASRAPIYENYDKQVQGRTFSERAIAESGLLTPFNEEKYPAEIRNTTVTLGVAQNPHYNEIDAYWGAVNAVVEAARKNVAFGCWPVALTDCLCFGNPENPECMGELVNAIHGIIDASKAISMPDNSQVTLPVISGNVSLYNQSSDGAIPPSPIISCLGVSNDWYKTVQANLPPAELQLIMIGERRDECGGSVYYQTQNWQSNTLPKPELSQLQNELEAVYQAIQHDLIVAAQCIGIGGVAIALAKMCFHQQVGVNVNIPGDLPIDKRLFSESGGFILAVHPANISKIESLFAHYQLPFYLIGKSTDSAELQLNGVITMQVDKAKSLWSNGLQELLS